MNHMCTGTLLPLTRPRALVSSTWPELRHLGPLRCREMHRQMDPGSIKRICATLNLNSLRTACLQFPLFPPL
jgi:hypothetical protein